MRRRYFIAVALAAAGTLAGLNGKPAAAASDWPTQTVNVIVPWAAGGGTDPLARLIFADMSERLGQAFPIDFRPGAAGTIGSTALAKAAPDGYTIMLTSNAPAVNANFMPNVAYDPKTDLVPVLQIIEATTFVTANVNTPYNNFQELIDYAKANPGKINAAFSGIGGGSHAALSFIQHKTGVKFNLVPYTGAGAQQADLMAGTVDIGVGFPTGFLPGVKAGKLKFIAVLAKQRNPFLTEVPTSDESTYKGIYKGNWYVVFVPKGTPRPIIDKINAEFKITVANPEIKKKIEALGYAIVTGSPEDAVELIKTDVADMKELIDAGVFTIE